MSDRRRIAFVIPSLEPGGTERQLTYLVEGLQAEWDVLVVCTSQPGAWAEDVAQHARVESLGLSSGWDPRLYTKLRRLFSEFRPDVVQTFLFGFDYWANRAARRSGVRAVVNARRQLPHWKRGRHVWWQRRANRRTDAIVANAEAVARYCAEQEREPLDRYTVIHNGIDAVAWDCEETKEEARAALGISDGGCVIGMVGNFGPEKEHQLFVDVTDWLTRKHDNLRCVIAARGVMPEVLANKARRLREAGILHHADDANVPMSTVYRALDVLVVTSFAEGFPNAVLEAMASGVPVVASKVGGIPEAIRDGETGALIEERTVQNFAHAISGLLDDPERCARMADTARADVAERFSLRRMVDAYKKLYTGLLEDR